jgi:hypothetical protein
MDAFVYSIPSWLLFLLLVGGSVVLTWLGTVLLRRITTDPMDEKHNEVAGFIFATVGVLYAVLLAFTVIIVWEQYLSAESAVSQEAAALITIAHDASSFPEPERSQVYEQLRAYAQFVTNEEWRTMDEATLEHEESTGAQASINKIWSIYRSLARRPVVRAGTWGSGDDLLRPGLTHEECPAPCSNGGLAGGFDRHVHLDDRDDQSSLRR